MAMTWSVGQRCPACRGGCREDRHGTAGGTGGMTTGVMKTQKTIETQRPGLFTIEAETPGRRPGTRAGHGSADVSRPQNTLCRVSSTPDSSSETRLGDIFFRPRSQEAPSFARRSI